jgi:hypothetical protein
LVWLALNASPSAKSLNIINIEAGALADEEVGNAIAGDWVKVNDVFYTIITTSPTVESDFLLIGNVTQLVVLPMLTLTF